MTPNKDDLTTAQTVGLVLCTVGATMLLSWNYKVTIGLALVKFGSLLIQDDPKEKL